MKILYTVVICVFCFWFLVHFSPVMRAIKKAEIDKKMIDDKYAKGFGETRPYRTVRVDGCHYSTSVKYGVKYFVQNTNGVTEETVMGQSRDIWIVYKCSCGDFKEIEIPMPNNSDELGITCSVCQKKTTFSMVCGSLRLNE